MAIRFGLLAPLALFAAPLAAEPWALPRSDVVETAAPDGHVYRVLVAWPEGPPPREGWPVLWVLDGVDNFAVATVTARRLAQAGKRSGVENGVIVALDSGSLARRITDYTPHVPGYVIAPGKPAHGFALGGADRFLDFIDARLRPMLAERLPIDPRRQTLAGHSFGGLLALHAARQGRNYSGFAAVSPSLWYGDGEFPAHPPTSAARRASRLLVAISPEAGDAGQAGRDVARDLAGDWQAAGYDTQFLDLPGQDHGSTMLAAMSAIIKTAFSSEETPCC
ncbi:alpha/beta hydrolase [Novosphingobium profundi]|uniref:alpha/beta hydrolase n=1 Tax=Novosphingobium profundi TaxID=1774954 RepID=UPI001BD9C207|nr:alpha/beta hydrolase-fold protein [Novosphingobium profundi]MBT0668507.1 alpha/beta hydrolase [Novosphingobium profundi]